MKIEVAFRVEDELKLIESRAESITVKRRVGSGKEELARIVSRTRCSA
jgi:hypothetical protein